MTEPMRVLVGGRGSGKTSALIRWQAQGHPLPNWPMWSRVVLVETAEMARAFSEQIAGVFDDLWTPRHHELMAEQLADDDNDHVSEDEARRMTRLAMMRSVMTTGSAAGLERLRGAHIEIGIDNVDLMLSRLLGLGTMPTQITITGQAHEL